MLRQVVPCGYLLRRTDQMPMRANRFLQEKGAQLSAWAASDVLNHVRLTLQELLSRVISGYLSRRNGFVRAGCHAGRGTSAEGAPRKRPPGAGPGNFNPRSVWACGERLGNWDAARCTPTRELEGGASPASTAVYTRGHAWNYFWYGC